MIPFWDRDNDPPLGKVSFSLGRWTVFVKYPTRSVWIALKGDRLHRPYNQFLWHFTKSTLPRIEKYAILKAQELSERDIALGFYSRKVDQVLEKYDGQITK